RARKGSPDSAVKCTSPGTCRGSTPTAFCTLDGAYDRSSLRALFSSTLDAVRVVFPPFDLVSKSIQRVLCNVIVRIVDWSWAVRRCTLPGLVVCIPPNSKASSAEAHLLPIEIAAHHPVVSLRPIVNDGTRVDVGAVVDGDLFGPDRAAVVDSAVAASQPRAPPPVVATPARQL